MGDNTGNGDDVGGAQKLLAVRAQVPTFDAENFELYLTNLEMWSFTSLTPKNMKGAMLFQSLPNKHSSGIKQRILDQISVQQETCLKGMMEGKAKYAQLYFLSQYFDASNRH